MTDQPKVSADALRRITKAWEAHDSNGVVKLSMEDADIIHAALTASHSAADEGMVRDVPKWVADLCNGLMRAAMKDNFYLSRDECIYLLGGIGNVAALAGTEKQT